MIPSSAPPPPPPLSPYGTLAGELFQYAPNLVAFESTVSASAAAVGGESSGASTLPERKLILLGGLGDGLLPVPYTTKLDQLCRDTSGSNTTKNNAASWSLVQPLLTSSYTGFGHGSLDRDVSEIVQLCTYLQTHRAATHVALWGHSTGCQDIAHLLQTRTHDSLSPTKLTAVVLQAPVADREHPAAVDPGAYQRALQTAQSLVDTGEGDTMMPRSAFWAPITAKRFVDLHAVNGADDYFASDFTNKQLSDRLACDDWSQTWPDLQHYLMVWSGADEYVRPGLDGVAHTQRLADMTHHPGAQGIYLPTANHNLAQGNADGSDFDILLWPAVQRILND